MNREKQIETPPSDSDLRYLESTYGRDPDVHLVARLVVEIRRLRAIVEPLEKLLGESGDALFFMRRKFAYRVIGAGRDIDVTADTLTDALAAAVKGLER